VDEKVKRLINPFAEIWSNTMLLKFSNGKYSSINGSWTNLVAFESHYGGNNK